MEEKQPRNRKLNIEFFRDLAIKQGGKCLSVEYVNNKTHLLFECAEKHQWQASPNNVKGHNSWCPECAQQNNTIGERLTRETLKECFPNKNFDKTRKPKWLGGLELDCYNEELRLAAEYNGIQHYEVCPKFHRNIEDLKSQQERDSKKKNLCEENKCDLIIVPWNISFINIRDYVKNEIKKIGKVYSSSEMSNLDFYCAVRAKDPHSKEMYEKIKKMAIKKGGEIISKEYLGYNEVHEFKCDSNHIFKATPTDMMRDDVMGTPRWCPQCSPTRPKEEKEIKELVEGGEKWIYDETKNELRKGRMRRIVYMKCAKDPTHIRFTDISNLQRETAECKLCGSNDRCLRAAKMARELGWITSEIEIDTSRTQKHYYFNLICRKNTNHIRKPIEIAHIEDGQLLRCQECVEEEEEKYFHQLLQDNGWELLNEDHKSQPIKIQIQCAKHPKNIKTINKPQFIYTHLPCDECQEEKKLNEIQKIANDGGWKVIELYIDNSTGNKVHMVKLQCLKNPLHLKTITKNNLVRRSAPCADCYEDDKKDLIEDFAKKNGWQLMKIIEGKSIKLQLQCLKDFSHQKEVLLSTFKRTPTKCLKCKGSDEKEIVEDLAIKNGWKVVRIVKGAKPRVILECLKNSSHEKVISLDIFIKNPSRCDSCK